MFRKTYKNQPKNKKNLEMLSSPFFPKFFLVFLGPFDPLIHCTTNKNMLASKHAQVRKLQVQSVKGPGHLYL